MRVNRRIEPNHGALCPLRHSFRMTCTFVRAEPDEFVERMARNFVERYDADGPAEIAAIVEMLVEADRIDTARLWTRIMHASRRLLESEYTPRFH